ncbi:MAG: S1C family serine protease [Dehalococcoidia bacterium]
MLKKIKYILIALALISLMLGSSGCSLLPPWSPTPSPPVPSPPVPSPPASRGEYTNPDWTSPSKSSEAGMPLPSIADVVEQIMPSVVSVTTEMVVYDIFQREYMQSAAGSGAIIDSEGYIVTNNHVVQNARRVQVELADGRTFSANIVGTDALTDLAVLKIEATDLPYAYLGDSDLLAVGDWVVAIGNALGEGISASEGIISRLNVSVTAQGNTLSGLIQTTAAINPGNSGGPLVNTAGEVIGITSIKMAAVGIEGMGYAISVNNAKPVIEDLIHQGYVIRPWLGVGLYTVDPFVAAVNNLSVDKGALIVEIVADSPAKIAGLGEGDVIIRFADKEIVSSDDLIQAILDCQIGQGVEITFVRGEDTKTTWAQLQESPPPWG